MTIKLTKPQCERLREISVEVRYLRSFQFSPKTTERLHELGLIEKIPSRFARWPAVAQINDAGRAALAEADR